MIDGLEVVDDQAVVLAPLETVESNDRRRGTARAPRPAQYRPRAPRSRLWHGIARWEHSASSSRRAPTASTATAGTMSLTCLIVEAPIELQSRVQPDGTVALEVAPPRQAMETTVMPVLHRIRIDVVADR